MFVLCNSGSRLSLKGLFCEDQSEQNTCVFFFIEEDNKKEETLQFRAEAVKVQFALACMLT